MIFFAVNPDQQWYVGHGINCSNKLQNIKHCSVAQAVVCISLRLENFSPFWDLQFPQRRRETCTTIKYLQERTPKQVWKKRSRRDNPRSACQNVDKPICLTSQKMFPCVKSNLRPKDYYKIVNCRHCFPQFLAAQEPSQS